jgi:hypothetical protein
MPDLSKKAFKAKGFTLIGAPDPNGDIAAQVDALQNLLANGANVLVLRSLELAETEGKRKLLAASSCFVWRRPPPHGQPVLTPAIEG